MVGLIKLRPSLTWTETPNVLGRGLLIHKGRNTALFIGSFLVDYLYLYEKSQKTQTQVQAQPLLRKTGNNL